MARIICPHERKYNLQEPCPYERCHAYNKQWARVVGAEPRQEYPLYPKFPNMTRTRWGYPAAATVYHDNVLGDWQ